MAHSKASRERERGSVWLFGTHPVIAALNNPERDPRRLLIVGETPTSLPEERLIGLKPERVSRAEIEARLPPGAVHQGVALLASVLAPRPIEVVFEASAPRLAVVLDRVTDPHNVGAIVRSAAAFGASAVIVTERHAPPLSGTLAKAAAGALETMPVVRVVNLARALDRLKLEGFRVMGLDLAASRTLADALDGAKATGSGANATGGARASAPEDVALVLGAEGRGLRRLTAERCDERVRLPIATAVESLNVSNAAAIALYALSSRC